MKKTFFSILALACFAQADDAPTYQIKDDGFSQDDKGKITLDEVAQTFNTGTFAFSFDLDLVLGYTGEKFDFNFAFGDGAQSGGLSLSYAPNSLAMFSPAPYLLTIGGNVEGGVSMDNMVFFSENSGKLIFQVNDLFGDTRSATLSWCEDDGAHWSELWSGNITGTLPSTITNASATMTANGGAVVPPVEKIEFTAWQGEVAAEDIQNPTPAPSVPEPATATLSLLALAGLAVRRRRK